MDSLIAIAAILALLAGPLGLGIWGIICTRRMPQAAGSARGSASSWRLGATSALLYTLAFNIVFFIQELFLVLPKALTPGLRPVLFHNNHTWEGNNPLARLFQGTGVLATFLTGIVCALLIGRASRASPTVRLLLIWLAYNGLFQSLPQAVVGAVSPANDVGMAMDYLHMSPAWKMTAALLALAAMPPIALWLTRSVLRLASQATQVDTARARNRFVFQVATAPALVAILLIIPYRIPRNFIEVVLVPAVVTFIGIVWMQAGAWRMRAVQPNGAASRGRLAYPAAALLILLLIFQLLLRPGIRF